MRILLASLLLQPLTLAAAKLLTNQRKNA